MSLSEIAFPASHAAREVQAFATLKASLSALVDFEADNGLLVAVAEGQTNLFDAIDALLHDDLHDRTIVESLKVAIAELETRRRRFETRMQARRAVLEQALSTLDRPTLERPTATISLTVRAPMLEVTDKSLLPAKFFASRPVLDRRTLKTALEQGKSCAGARLVTAS